MKKLSIALALVLLAVPALAPAEMQKAKTIDELAAMFDSKSCKECHEAQYAQWEKSHHARPFAGVAGGLMLTPVVKAGPFKLAKAEDATLKSFPCFKCHLPQAVRWAEDSVAKELASALMSDPQNKAQVMKLQITCKVCHWEVAIIHHLTEGQPKDGVIYGSKAGAHDDKVFSKMEKSSILKQAVFCGQCHGTGPNFEFDNPIQCATLYGSYQHNYLSNGGLDTCQDCHMKKKDGVSDHLIAPNFDDKEATGKLLASAINLNIQTLGFQYLRKAGALTPKVVVNTKITTTAGHRIPDG
jgi:hypothetical protein